MAIAAGAVALVAAVAVAAFVAARWHREGAPAAQAMPARAAGAAHAASHALGREQVAAMAERLARRLQGQPGDAEGWAMLARSHAALGRMADAVPAYAKAVALRPDDAQLLADHADALAQHQGRLDGGEPLALVRRALQRDPDNLKALSLAGTAAFAAQDHAGAVAHWERLARVGPPDHPLVRHIQVSIEEARRLGRLPATK